MISEQTSFSQLRGGFTTGTCAAAAAKAALLLLAGNTNTTSVDVNLPDGSSACFSIEECVVLGINRARASVQKNSGDDPDITNKMFVVVDVEVSSKPGNVVFVGGDGVGKVTKPGLQIPVGEPAINPGPRILIEQAVRSVEPHREVIVTISIPGGKERAAHTFNPKLGIEGGLSVLGTSGRIVPRSQEAWFRSLLPQLDVAKALGHETIFVTPGSFGLALRKYFPEVCDEVVVHAGNFIGDILLECAKREFKHVILAGHSGKLVKIAAGIWNTHSGVGDARLETIAAHAAVCGASPKAVFDILNAPTTEAAASFIDAECLSGVWHSLAQKAAERASDYSKIRVSSVFTAYGDRVLGWSRSLASVFENSKKEARISVVGLGPGASEWLSPAAWRVIYAADAIIGGKRQLEQVASLGKKNVPVTSDLNALSQAIRNLLSGCTDDVNTVGGPNCEVNCEVNYEVNCEVNCEDSVAVGRGKNIVVLASGDPTCYGILEFLMREFPESVAQVVPAVSSFQMALARLKLSWGNVAFASAHGRSVENVVNALQNEKAVLTLTDANASPIVIAKNICIHFPGVDFRFVVMERLGYCDEKITTLLAKDLGYQVFDSLSVMYIEKQTGGVA